MENEESALLATRQRDWENASAVSTYITWGGAALLVVLIIAAGGVMGRDHRARETQVWLRTGQMGLATRLQGEQRLETLGEHVLAFLADYLNAQVGAVYVSEGRGRSAASPATRSPPGRRARNFVTAKGSSARRPKRTASCTSPMCLPTICGSPSSLGQASPAEVVVAPASVDGIVHAVVELGFFRTIDPVERELLGRVSEALGVAVRASRDRTRLEELLEETQRQAEELQTQQEELRVSNEELEEQSRVLKESQARLESQQTELEQINAQLEEQTQILEHQKDALADAQLGLTEKAAELERSNQYKSEFLANMSHELRTPLNSPADPCQAAGRQQGRQPDGRAGQLRADDLLGRQRPARADQRHPRPLEDRGGQDRADHRIGAARQDRRRRWPRACSRSLSRSAWRSTSPSIPACRSTSSPTRSDWGRS